MSSSELSTWADPAMFEAEPIEGEGATVHLVSATADPLGSIAAACRMYEGKGTQSLAVISNDERRHYWEQVQKTHLKAPLEFVDLHFFIEGVTRAFTHQMVRQRTAVYAQESLRFAVKGDLVKETDYPPSLRDQSRQWERKSWTVALDNIEDTYTDLIQSGIPAEDARGLLPHATKTRLHYKTNLRNLLDHAGNRLCTQAQFEWREVFTGIVRAIHNHQPPLGLQAGVTDWQFKHIADSQVFKPVCFSLGHCPFTAVFDRQCTIRERVQRGAFQEVHSAEWLADPTAGRSDNPSDQF